MWCRVVWSRYLLSVQLLELMIFVAIWLFEHADLPHTQTVAHVMDILEKLGNNEVE